MAFALTKFIYPIETELFLSNTMGISIDNPRTEEEIALVKNHISEILLDRDSFLVHGDVPIQARLFNSISDLKDGLKQNKKKNSYALDFFDKSEMKEFTDLLAEIWMIIRFSDKDGFFKGLFELEHKELLLNHLFYGENKTYAASFNEMKNYCNILSLLISELDYHYYGESFLLNEYPQDIFFKSKSSEIERAVNIFIDCNFSSKEYPSKELWFYWPSISETIEIKAKTIEDFVVNDNFKESKKQQTAQDKLLHIGGILSAAYQQTINPELMLLLTVSSIEYLLTRNPDTNKFNVEDSISRQFRLKTAIVVHKQNNELALDQLGKELKEIYNLRSDIAHGNYKEDFNIENIADTTFKLFHYIRYIIKEYIENKNLIDFLKAN